MEKKVALNPVQFAILMSKLPAASRQAVNFLAKTKGKTPQEVLEECLREYIAGRVPQVDVSAALSAARGVMHNLGYAFGSLRNLARRARDDE